MATNSKQFTNTGTEEYFMSLGFDSLKYDIVMGSGSAVYPVWDYEISQSEQIPENSENTVLIETSIRGEETNWKRSSDLEDELINVSNSLETQFVELKGYLEKSDTLTPFRRFSSRRRHGGGLPDFSTFGLNTLKYRFIIE